MAKKAAKKVLSTAQIHKALKFKIDWIKDPVPPFRQHLNKAALTKIQAAKVAFGKQVDAIVKDAMRKG